jgi:hypothetical protein
MEMTWKPSWRALLSALGELASSDPVTARPTHGDDVLEDMVVRFFVRVRVIRHRAEGIQVGCDSSSTRTTNKGHRDNRLLNFAPNFVQRDNITKRKVTSYPRFKSLDPGADRCCPPQS